MNEINDKTIFRRAKDKDNPYAMIDRSIFENEALSWKAKGLMGYLLSRPDDWKVWMADLKKRSTDGRDAVASAVKELEAAGHMTRHQNRDDRGRFAGLVVLVHEVPVPPEQRTALAYDLSEVNITPETGFPETVQPEPENPVYTNKDSTDKNDTDTLEGASASTDSPPIKGEIDWEEPERSVMLELAIEELSRVLGDFHHVKSNVTQAYNIFKATSLGEYEFKAKMDEAAAITKVAINRGRIKDHNKRMAYFFGVLRDILGQHG